MEVKIEIPNNCELIKDGNTYIVKEKKQIPPRSWEEFCKKYPVKKGECYIDPADEDTPITDAIFSIGKYRKSASWCSSKEEAEAFLALMQLRQLKKAWVGDWEPSGYGYYAIVYEIKDRPIVGFYEKVNRSLSFPTKNMAADFLGCFRDLCETAKTLL